MAFTSVGSIATNTSTTSSTTLAMTLTVAASVGNMLFAIIGKDNTDTTSVITPLSGTSNEVISVTDTGGNTWVKAGEVRFSPTAAAADGAVASLFYTVVTTAMAITSGVITANFSAATTAKAGRVWKFTSSTGNSLKVVGTPSGVTSTVAAQGSLDTTPSVSGPYLWMRVGATEGGTVTWTVTTNFTALTVAGTGTANTSNVSVGGEFRVFTGVSNASAPSWSAAGDNVSMYFGFFDSNLQGGAGSSTGAGLATGAGSQILSSTASAAGTSAASGSGVGIVNTTSTMTGTIVGTSTAAGSLKSTSSSPGTSTGTSAATGVGLGAKVMVASASVTSAASASMAVVRGGAGSSVVTSSASGVAGVFVDLGLGGFGASSVSSSVFTVAASTDWNVGDILVLSLEQSGATSTPPTTPWNTNNFVAVSDPLGNNWVKMGEVTITDNTSALYVAQITTPVPNGTLLTVTLATSTLAKVGIVQRFYSPPGYTYKVESIAASVATTTSQPPSMTTPTLSVGVDYLVYRTCAYNGNAGQTFFINTSGSSTWTAANIDSTSTGTYASDRTITGEYAIHTPATAHALTSAPSTGGSPGAVISTDHLLVLSKTISGTISAATGVSDGTSISNGIANVISPATGSSTVVGCVASATGTTVVRTTGTSSNTTTVQAVPNNIIFIGSCGTGSTSTGGNILLSASIDWNVDDMILITVAADNTGTTSLGSTFDEFSTISDSHSNNWVSVGNVENSPSGAQNDGTSIKAFLSRISVGIPSGPAAVTINNTYGTPVAVARAYKIYPGADYRLLSVGIPSVAADNTTALSSLTVSGLNNVEHIFVRAVGVELAGETRSTVSSGWSELGVSSLGSTTSGQAVMGEYLISKATTATSNGYVVSTAADSVSMFFALEQADKSGILAGTGVSAVTALATAIGTMIEAVVATSTGTSTTSAAITAFKPTVGSSIGASTTSGVFSATTSGSSTIVGTSVTSGAGTAVLSVVGSSAAAATVSGVGIYTWSEPGVAPGTANASAVGSAILTSPGSMSVTAVMSGTGVTLKVASGSSVGAGTASGALIATSSSPGFVNVTSVATAIGSMVKSTIDTAIGTSAALGVFIATTTGTASAVGTAVATGALIATTTATGALVGTSAASGLATGIGTTIGSSTGVGTVTGVGARIRTGAGSSTVTSGVAAIPTGLQDLGQVGTGTIPGSATSVVITASKTWPAGSTILVYIAKDNVVSPPGGKNISSTTDPDGNSWTQLDDFSYSPGGVTSDGVTLLCLWSYITSAKAPGSTFTVTFSQSVTAVTAIAQGFWTTPGTFLSRSITPLDAGVTDTNVAATVITPTEEAVLFKVVGFESGSATFSSTGVGNLIPEISMGTGTSGMSISGVYKIASSGSQSLSGTLSTSSDMAYTFMSFPVVSSTTVGAGASAAISSVTATGIALQTLSATASCIGTAVASAIDTAVISATGSSTVASVASGVLKSTSAATASVTSTSTATAVSNQITSITCTSNGSAACTAIGISTATFNGVSSGTGVASGVFRTTTAGTATGTGTSTTTGSGVRILTGVGSATGVGVVTGVGTSVFKAVGSSASTSLMTGLPHHIIFLGQIGSSSLVQASYTGTSTSQITTTAALNINDVAITLVAADSYLPQDNPPYGGAYNQETYVADAYGNVWTQMAGATNSGGATASGQMLGVAIGAHLSVITVPIPLGGQVQAGSSNPVPNSAATLLKFYTPPGYTLALGNPGAEPYVISDSVPAAGSLTISGLTSGTEYLILRLVGIEASSGLTPTSSTWTGLSASQASTGTASTSITVAGELLVKSNLTSINSNPSWTTGGDSASIMFMFNMIPQAQTLSITGTVNTAAGVVANGVGSSTAVTVGTDVGTSLAVGAGAWNAATSGSSTATSTATGAGVKILAGVGSMTATSSASAVGGSNLLVGVITGTSTSTGVGAKVLAGVGSSVSVVTNSVFSPVVSGSTSGTSVASAIGRTVSPITGVGPGTSTASGVATLITPIAGSTTGTSTTTGFGAMIEGNAGTIIATASSNVILSATATTKMLNTVVATANGVGTGIKVSPGTSVCTSAASGVIRAVKAMAGSSVSTPVVSGVMSSTALLNMLSTGTSTASGVITRVQPAAGTATSSSSMLGTGMYIMSIKGTVNVTVTYNIVLSNIVKMVGTVSVESYAAGNLSQIEVSSPSASGTSQARGVATAVRSGQGFVVTQSDVFATGSMRLLSSGTSVVTSSANAVPGITGSASVVSVASAAGIAIKTIKATSSGVAVVSAVGVDQFSSVGTASSTSIAVAKGSSTAVTTVSSSGSSVLAGIGVTLVSCSGTVTGVTSSAAVGTRIVTSSGSVTTVVGASAVGRSFNVGLGQAGTSSSAIAKGNAVKSVVGTIASSAVSAGKLLATSKSSASSVGSASVNGSAVLLHTIIAPMNGSVVVSSTVDAEGIGYYNPLLDTTKPSAGPNTIRKSVSGSPNQVLNTILSADNDVNVRNKVTRIPTKVMGANNGKGGRITVIRSK